jgi:hypothetical protein
VLGKVRQHRLQDFWEDWCAGVIVEVDAAHGTVGYFTLIGWISGCFCTWLGR